MPRQPLSRVVPNPNLKIGAPFLQHRPTLIPHILRVIAIWASIDHLMLQILTGFLKADFEVVVKMMNALSGAEGKKAAIDAAAVQALPQEDYDIFQAIQSLSKPSRDTRNAFAHHIWAVEPSIENGLCLIDPKLLGNHHALMMTRFAAVDSALFDANTKADDLISLINNSPKLDYSSIPVYREKDFHEEVEKAQRAEMRTNGFMLYRATAPLGGSMHDELRWTLSNDHEIQSVIQKKYKQKAPLGPP